MYAKEIVETEHAHLFRVRLYHVHRVHPVVHQTAATTAAVLAFVARPRRIIRRRCRSRADERTQCHDYSRSRSMILPRRRMAAAAATTTEDSSRKITWLVVVRTGVCVA